MSRADIDALLATTQSPASFGAVLTAAAAVKGANGVSKLPALLDRFMDHVANDVGVANVQPIVEALFDVGDNLLSPTDERSGMFDSGNERRIGRIAYHLLKKVEPGQRAPLLLRTLVHGKAPRCSQYLIGWLVQEAEKMAKGEGDALMTVADGQTLKAAWCERVRHLAAAPGFIDHPSVAWLLSTWREWSGTDEAVTWWQAAAASDEGLLKLISAQSVRSRSQSGSDLGWRIRLRMDPRGLEPYGEVEALADRVRALLDAGAVAVPHQSAAKVFVRACERMKAGMHPDAFGFFDD